VTKARDRILAAAIRLLKRNGVEDTRVIVGDLSFLAEVDAALEERPSASPDIGADIPGGGAV
jgi:ATP phosphoribosyltransferase regulatory subunit HisZ